MCTSVTNQDTVWTRPPGTKHETLHPSTRTSPSLRLTRVFNRVLFESASSIKQLENWSDVRHSRLAKLTEAWAVSMAAVKMDMVRRSWSELSARPAHSTSWTLVTPRKSRVTSPDGKGKKGVWLHDTALLNCLQISWRNTKRKQGCLSCL